MLLVFLSGVSTKSFRNPTILTYTIRFAYDIIVQINIDESSL